MVDTDTRDTICGVKTAANARSFQPFLHFTVDPNGKQRGQNHYDGYQTDAVKKRIFKRDEKIGAVKESFKMIEGDKMTRFTQQAAVIQAGMNQVEYWINRKTGTAAVSPEL